MNTDRFRFRVWDGQNYVDRFMPLCINRNGSLICPLNGGVMNPNVFHIEQCTGLKDWNGKLIYEGDVVRVENECGICDPDEDCNTGIGVITWECEMWYIQPNVNLCLYDTSFINYIEVIGNIHEDQFRDLTELMESEVEDE